MIFFHDNESSEARYAKDRFEECILLFYSEEEKEKFKNYAISKWGSRDKYLKDIHIPYMELPDSYRPKAFKEDYENMLKAWKRVLFQSKSLHPLLCYGAYINSLSYVLQRVASNLPSGKCWSYVKI